MYHPSRPGARTCCFFSSFKTFALPREATCPPAGASVLDAYSCWPVLNLYSLAGFDRLLRQYEPDSRVHGKVLLVHRAGRMPLFAEEKTNDRDAFGVDDDDSLRPRERCTGPCPASRSEEPGTCSNEEPVAD
jgi:hypothetical protein